MTSNPFNRFTSDAKNCLQFAESEAKKEGSFYIGTEHLLLGIVHMPQSLGATILLGTGISFETVKMSIVHSGIKETPNGEGTMERPVLSTYLARIIENALKAALDFHHSFVGTEHLLYAILHHEKCTANILLGKMEVNVDVLKNQIAEIFSQINDTTKRTSSTDGQHISSSLESLLHGLQGALVSLQKKDHKDKSPRKGQKSGKMNDRSAEKNKLLEESETPALDYFAMDLNREYREGRLFSVIGRDEEIERTIHILNRKTKNNPVLIGEPGVGKTAIVEGLAAAIEQKNVPALLLDKRVMVLDLSEMVAGTKYRGEFEERMKDVLDDAMTSEKGVILFIDELHTMIGAGAAEGSLDAANIIKPALARGKIQLIGATTLDEYKKHIERDKALERRFQKIIVEEPTTDETMKILQGIRPDFEDFHSLSITDEALESSISFSKRFITDRFLPDKAIDLIDEASAKKGGRNHKNTEDILKLEKKLVKILEQKKSSVENQKYKRAVELKEEEQLLQRGIEELKNKKPEKISSVKINKNDIAEVVSRSTGIPLTKLTKEETEQLLDLEKALKKSIIGQDEAIEEVSVSIRRSRAGIASPDRPIGSFVFLGPSGVGKTELVKTIAQEVYQSSDALIRVDMSEFMERHNVSRLIGATAGYVGYEEGGQLTESIRRKPYSVILFDEIEKAHTDVFNILLQILEEGQLTDGQGRKVDFRNTIVVMTSNIGGQLLTEEAKSIGFAKTKEEIFKAEQHFEERKDQVSEELKEYFRPEFLNRIDHVIIFRPLSQKQIKKIISLHLVKMNERLQEKKITVIASDLVMNALAKEAYKPSDGARLVRKLLQEEIEGPLAHMLLSGKVREGDTVKLVRAKEKGGRFELVKQGKKR